jgi:hypothetical protein
LDGFSKKIGRTVIGEIILGIVQDSLGRMYFPEFSAALVDLLGN